MNNFNKLKVVGRVNERQLQVGDICFFKADAQANDMSLFDCLHE